MTTTTKQQTNKQTKMFLNNKWVALEQVTYEEMKKRMSSEEWIEITEEDRDYEPAKCSQGPLHLRYSPLYLKFRQEMKSIDAVICDFCENQVKTTTSVPRQVMDLIWEFVYYKTFSVHCSLDIRCRLTVNLNVLDLELSGFTSRYNLTGSNQTLLGSRNTPSETSLLWPPSSEQLSVKYYSFITWQTIGVVNIPLPGKIIRQVIRERYDKLKETLLNKSSEEGQEIEDSFALLNSTPHFSLSSVGIKISTSTSTESDIDDIIGYTSFSRRMAEKGFVSTTIVAFLSNHGILTALIIDSQ
ncbi:hypothetical protein RFI_20405, partial [Reticulomyxa filosa]